jgi:5-(carboxyamino)imidazole ribonucleotide mutase
MKIDVGIIMGSRSDWETMRHTTETLDELGVSYEVKVVSAHRTPDLLFEYAGSAVERGLKVIIAGAGGAAHLPGMAASKTRLPVLGVPVQSKALNGMDSLLSIAQMPAGIPANEDADIAQALDSFRQNQTDKVLGDSDPRT